ncbi:cytochrome P450 [Microlunatus ginsengisoli]|uniref:Cytochrome P450 n=1 Tax=Microlunatus ginsengisoli TaxID=363863 RepID=A0ABP7AH01_9ACTN
MTAVGPTADPLTFPIRRTCPAALPEAYERERPKGISTVRLPTGQTAWIVLSQAYARAVLADSRFSADKLRPDFPKLSAKGLDKLKYFAPFIVNLDGRDHIDVRRSLTAEFSGGRVAQLRPRLEAVTERLVTEIGRDPGRPIDLVARLAYPAAWAFQEVLLGLPVAELSRIRRHTEDLLIRTTSEAEEIEAARVLHEHLAGVLRAKEDDLGDDLVSRQILRHRAEKGRVDHFELASLVQLLTVGGHNSVATMVSLGVLALLTHRDQLAVLLAEPDRWPIAVEELLRFYSVNDATPLRLATADVQLGDTVIRAGDGVAIPLLPPNRDPAVCPDPNALDLLRARSPRHIAFGHGAHRCLGYSLAPVELEVVYRELFAQLPGLRLAVAEDELSFRYHSPQAFGPVELPVSW